MVSSGGSAGINCKPTCQWYIDSHEQCAVVVIAFYLAELNNINLSKSFTITSADDEEVSKDESREAE